MSKKVHYAILECFTIHKKMLLSFFLITLDLRLKLNIKATHGKRIKMLTPELIIEKLPIALACVEAHNTSLHLVDKIRQFICSLLREKEITN